MEEWEIVGVPEQLVAARKIDELKKTDQYIQMRQKLIARAENELFGLCEAYGKAKGTSEEVRAAVTLIRRYDHFCSMGLLGESQK